MDRIIGQDLLAAFGRARLAVQSAFQGLTDPWTLRQIVLIAIVLAIGQLAGHLIERGLEPRVREVRGRRRLLRFLALLLRRTRWIVTALGLWAAVLAMRSVTWPSYSHLIQMAALLVTAWVVISVLSRLIRNRLAARFVAFVAWTIVALRITGQFETATRALDAAGFSVGETRVSLLLVVNAALVIGALLWIAVAAGNFAERRIAATGELTPTIRVLLGKLTRIALVAIAALVALNIVGIDLTALTVFSGAVGLGLGFGLQKIVSNFISGIIILLDKSIKPGDTISLGETFGWIRTLHSRYVSVKTRDGKEYLIPNEDFITNQVVNWSYTESLTRLDVELRASYQDDPHRVRELAISAAKGVDRVLPSPSPVCWLTAFGESSLDYLLRFWIRDPQNGVTNVKGQVLLACWDAFQANGVSVPYTRREIVLREPVEVRVRRDDLPP